MVLQVGSDARGLPNPPSKTLPCGAVGGHLARQRVPYTGAEL